MDLFKARHDHSAQGMVESKPDRVQELQPPPAHLSTHINRRRMPSSKGSKNSNQKPAPALKIQAVKKPDPATKRAAFDADEREREGYGRIGVPSANVQSASPQTRLLKLREVLERVKISRSLLYELIRDAAAPFPAPVRMGGRSMWIEDEIEAFLLSARSGRTTER